MAFLDNNGLARLWDHIVARLNTKVDAVDGKGLSTEDYTTEDKIALGHLGDLVGGTSVSEQINSALENSKADWNENDSTSANYVSNRTHWLEDPELVVLMDGTYEFTSVDDNYQYSGNCDFVFVDGQEYIVMFDGVEYVRTAEYIYGAVMIGNTTFAGIDSAGDDNFLLIQYDNSIDVVTNLSGETHTVKITAIESVVHQLDEKFIPDSITSDCIVDISKSGKYLSYTFKGGGSGSLGIIGKSGSNTDSEIFNDYTNNTATGKYSHAEGYKNAAGNYAAHAEGGETKATGMYSHSEGYKTTADEDCSHAEGSVTIASGNASHAEGQGSVASGQTAHAEGYNATAMGVAAHAEGRGSSAVPADITTSTSDDSIITTWTTTKFNLAKANSSHTEGENTLALDNCDHAEGYQSIASGGYSHAEGYQTRASSMSAHAEGANSIAKGGYSHAEGEGTLAYSSHQHVQGKFNIEDDSSDYAHIVGNGTSSARSNSHTVDWDGNAWFAGDVYVRSSSGTNKDDGSVKLATTVEVSEAIATKQDKLTGVEGQVVGFDANGNPVSQEAPESGSSVVTYVATIGTNWTENSDTGVKTQIVSIDGITADHTAKVDHYYNGDGSSDSYATFVEEGNQFLDFITNGFGKTVDGGIEFTIFGDQNTVEVPIVVEVV
jgi:hypothetical protein